MFNIMCTKFISGFFYLHENYSGLIGNGSMWQLRHMRFLMRIKRINKDMQLILYSPESLGNTYLKDNISQYIRMQNNQMIICEEISAPPVDLTDCNLAATTSTLCRHALHGGHGVDFRSLQ